MRRYRRGGPARSKSENPSRRPCGLAFLPGATRSPGGSARRGLRREAGGGVGGAAAAAASGSGGGAGAGPRGGRRLTHGPRRDGESGCSARVLRVGERLGDRGWPEPFRAVLEMLFLSVSGRSFSAARPRSRPGEEERAGPPRSVRPGGQGHGALTRCVGLLLLGHVDPRLRSMFQFHAGSWGSWCCCCCLIPADRPWDRERGRRWRLEMADTRSVHETRFEAAVKVIQSLPKNGKCAGLPQPSSRSLLQRPEAPVPERRLFEPSLGW